MTQEQLTKMVASIKTASAVDKKMLSDFAAQGYARTGYYNGRGRWTSACSHQKQVSALLANAGIKHICCNDAPRGGVTGELIILANRSLLKSICKSAYILKL